MAPPSVRHGIPNVPCYLTSEMVERLASEFPGAIEMLQEVKAASVEATKSKRKEYYKDYVEKLKKERPEVYAGYQEANNEKLKAKQKQDRKELKELRRMMHEKKSLKEPSEQ